ncbi:MAG: MjaI family restriction endonuclease [Alistipes sp.]|nr:MjaI family restriction endonuclease [Alistipes sp.]
MQVKIKNEQIASLSNAPTYSFPKYATQIINLANSDAQGTRPKVVGQMSELIKEFKGSSLSEWVEWYNSKQPDAIKNATDKIYSMFLEMKDAAGKIDRQMVENWVKDLVYTKTYVGLKFQEAIVSYIGNSLGLPYQLASVNQEALGIDGIIGSKPVSIKPITYKVQSNRLSETIEVPIVYYEKKKDGIVIEYNPDDFTTDNDIYSPRKD